MKPRLQWALLTLVLVLPRPARAQGADAKALFDSSCKSCHGADGKGSPTKAKTLKVAPQLLDLTRPETAKKPREQLRKVIAEGKEQMPGYAEELSPAEIEALVDYTKKLGAKSAARSKVIPR